MPQTCATIVARKYKAAAIAPGAYQCVCKPGWTGVNCEDDVNECTSSPCQNGGACVDSLSSGTKKIARDMYVCKCASGTSGINCETDVDECAKKPCFNNGVCLQASIGAAKKFSCVCKGGYLGELCHEVPQLCNADPNYAHASLAQQHASNCITGNCTMLCDKLDTGAIKCTTGCVCEDGWNGKYCENQQGVCKSEPRLNGATCFAKSIKDAGTLKAGEPLFTCHCVPGYDGWHCESDRNECLSNPCQNGAACYESGHALCKDDPDWVSYFGSKCNTYARNIPRNSFRFCDADIGSCVLVLWHRVFY